MGCVVRQQADINFLNDMVAYMQNLGAANDGKHQNMPSLMWCARTHACTHGSPVFKPKFWIQEIWPSLRDHYDHM